MRDDALGLFWEDLPPPPRAAKEKILRIPPKPVWLQDDYLPYLDEAIKFDVDAYTDDELIALTEPLMFDIECYVNYFLIAFKGIETGKVIWFESYFDNDYDIAKLWWLVENKLIVGFNSRKYDMCILNLALQSCDNQTLKFASNQIIVYGWMPWDVYKQLKVKDLTRDFNHIDLIEVAPLSSSLKIYAGRMHVERMQDLPFDPETILSEEQRLITRLYCINDLDNTGSLFNKLEPQIKLRIDMSMEYDIDLRSKSDAQIAEAVIKKQLRELNMDPQVPPMQEGMVYGYRIPHYLKFTSANMRYVLDVIANTDLIVSANNGRIELPELINQLEVPIGNAVYKMGIGGLHSTEKNVAYKSNEDFSLFDFDVTSYYPMIMLNQNLYPQHLGQIYLNIFRSLVDRRLNAKANGDKETAESLKITINGCFGKHGNMFSILYSPELVVQITLTGQLSLLLLIERLEQHDIPVVSANTDGIVIKCPQLKRDRMYKIAYDWQQETDFVLEETQYSAYYGRDVNNYIAIKKEGGTKTKGAFSDPGLKKNPNNTIIADAVIDYLTAGVLLEHTINVSRDLTKFLTVRTVKGGAYFDGEYLGKAIRWYHSVDIEGEIVYCSSGNKVAKSENSRPCLNLPGSFPTDIDHEWYINEAQKIIDIFSEEPKCMS